MCDFWEPAAQEPPGDQTPAASNLSLEIQISGGNTSGGNWKGTLPIWMLPSGTWCGEKALVTKRE